VNRWGLTADLHTQNHRILGGPIVGGVNLRCRLIGEAAARAFRLAADDGCDYFAVLGDIFDNGKPSPEVIGVMASAIASSPIPVYLIPGNHDCSSDEPGNHALAALREVKNCRVCDEPTYLEDGVILAPYSPRPPVEYFRDILAKATPGEKYILGHCGIIGQSTPIFLRDSKGAISVEQINDISAEFYGAHHSTENAVNLRGFYSGDYHMHAIHGGLLDVVNIVQVGALCQADFGDPPEVGKLCVLDTEAGGVVSFHDVPGPRFIKARCATGWLDISKIKMPDGCDLFYSVECETKEDAEWAEAVLGGVQGRVNPGGHRLRGWKIELAPTQAQQSEVVEAVRGAVQVGEALAEWVAVQPEPEAVRQRAVQIAEECLR
jgi:hypothetical protein